MIYFLQDYHYIYWVAYEFLNQLFPQKDLISKTYYSKIVYTLCIILTPYKQTLRTTKLTHQK